jgi:hypothetical protein
VAFEGVQDTGSVLYFLLSNIPYSFLPSLFKKKVRGGCKHPKADTQKPYTPKCGQGKTKLDLFRDFHKNYLCPSYEFYSS